MGEIGPTARAAIPALRAASTNGYYLIAARAKAALIKIQQEPITSLLNALRDTQSTNWRQAAQVAKYLGTNAEAAVPFLVDALESTDIGVREDAVSALGGIARRPDIAVPALTLFLQDRSADIRRDAIDALCKFKEARWQIVPLFLLCLQDTDNNVWLGAAFGLEDLMDQNAEKANALYSGSCKIPGRF